MSVTTRMREMISSFHAIYAIDIGVQLGLFEVLAATEPVNFSDFVSSTKYSSRYTEAWIRAMHAAQIIYVGEKGIVSFQEGWKEALTDQRSSEYVATLPACYTSVARAYSEYPALFRSGNIMDWRSMGKDVLEYVYADGIRFANYFINFVVDKIDGLREKLEAGSVVYDVGCGGGYFTVELAKAFKNSRFIGIDPWSESIELARELKSKNGLGDRVAFKKLCATKIPPDSADVVILNEVLHEMDEDLRLQSLKAIRYALRPGGGLFITDPLIPATHAGYLKPSANEVAMMMFSEAPLVNSRPLTREELIELLRLTHLGNITELDSSDVVMSAYIEPGNNSV